MRPVPKLVLYYPLQCDPSRGLVASRHLLPLSLLAISGWPLRDGYEVEIIDGNLYSQEEAHRRVREACEGALLYATTGILGYAVTDGLLCTRAVKAALPDLPCLIGGWFASTCPELNLETGLYDAVVLGQGEITFREVVAALACGETLESVAGLALWHDGALVRTAPRAVVGWEALLNFPWQLIDYSVYAEEQRKPGHEKTVEVCAPPPGFGPERPFTAISYFGSFGCPLDCSFCCSPETSLRRWKSMPAERMLDDVAELHERWGFDVLHFHDANWGVDRSRTVAWAEGMRERGLEFYYYTYMQSDSVNALSAEALDLLAETGLYTVLIGAETGSEATMKSLHKTTRGDGNIEAARALDARGISTYATYIIGLPDEEAASMMATLDQCRRMAVACPYSVPAVWDYQPIPGAALYAAALERGFVPPETLEGWGGFFDYRRDATPGWVPPEVNRMRKLYNHFTSVASGHARGRTGLWERRAMRRLAHEAGFRRAWPMGRLEARAFHLWSAFENRLPTWLRARDGGIEKGWRTRQEAPAPEYARREQGEELGT